MTDYVPNSDRSCVKLCNRLTNCITDSLVEYLTDRLYVDCMTMIGCPIVVQLVS